MVMSVATFPVKLLPLHYPKRELPILELSSEGAVAQQLEYFASCCGGDDGLSVS